ncbi:MAG: endonuclease/exonuclease/phosphatase family protein, partial [Candidatus Neomarinimicrobiota bacterium]
VLITLFFGCKIDQSETPQTDDPIMPNISSIGESNKIEIVTWNIENFPKAAYTTEYVKSIIEDLEADVFILQEIQSRNEFAAMLGEMDEYNYLLQTTASQLNFAIVYRSDVVSILNSTELFELDNDRFFAGRPPLLTKLEWQKDGVSKGLSIINVHYKCCGNNEVDSGNNSDEEYRRLKASELLEQYISDNLNNENVIVGGDFNDAIDEVALTNVFLAFLNKPADYKFVDMDIALSDESNWSWQGWSSSYPAIHFDHILINKNLFDEFQNSSVIDVIKLEEYFENGISDYDENVSDHRPVYLKISP